MTSIHAAVSADGPRRRSRLAAPIALFLIAALGCTTQLERHRWSERWGPMVPHHTFPEDCSLCHLPDRWDLLKDDFEFDHLEETGYELEGAHNQAACLRCHNDRGPVEEYLARGCGGCHADPHRSQLGVTCTRCHNQNWWRPDGLIAEHALTRFPLIASHAFAACESCHERATLGDFRGAPVECHLCHQEEALRATPNHVVNGWIRDCDDCHDPSEWFRFVHDEFPLLGAHAQADCLQCHTGGLIEATPTDCYVCHRNDYLAAPGHVSGGFSTQCNDCHDTFAWR